MEFVTTLMNWVVAHWDELFQIIGGLAVIATLTPNKSDDKIVQWLLDAINFGGANVGRASNGN
jgi:hypothetical protein